MALLISVRNRNVVPEICRRKILRYWLFPREFRQLFRDILNAVAYVRLIFLFSYAYFFPSYKSEKNKQV